MSASARRILQGNVASWAQIAVTLVAQLMLVPLFLAHWEKDVYGIWVNIQGITAILTIADFGFQDYLQYEYLRLSSQPRRARRLMWSALPIGLIVGAVEIVVAAVGVQAGLHVRLLAIPPRLVGSLGPEVVATLFSFLFATWVFGSVTGIAVRALPAYGYYPRMSWWNVLRALATTVLPVIVVASGGGFLAAGLTLSFSIVLVELPRTVDTLRLLAAKGLRPLRPNLRYGLATLRLSLALTGRGLIDILRQQGLRNVVAPMIGARKSVDFATMRTGSNVATQSLGTITGPIMPELMRYLHARDQARVEMAFGTVWLVVLGFLAPGTILVQALAPSLFELWLHGKVQYDAPTFGMLSVAILVIATAQPASQVSRGNNLLRIQLAMSTVATGITVGLTLLLVPRIGFRGAAFALLVAEIVVGVMAVGSANAWMRANGLRWPWASLLRVSLSIASTGVFVAICSAFPDRAIPAAFVGVAAQFGFVALYWRSLPVAARERAQELVRSRLPKRWR